MRAVPQGRDGLTRYLLRIPCGCEVEVTADPQRPSAAIRAIRRRAASCPTRNHTPGARVYLWELLPRRVVNFLRD
jgi:hypothetical protein